jgi:hypothetical protein
MQSILSSQRTGKPLVYLAVVLLCMAAGWGVMRTLAVSQPRLQIDALADPECDLRAGPCTTMLGNGRAIKFSIEPRSIPPLLPLSLRVDTIGFTAQAVDVELNGVDMNMGFNRFALQPDAQGHFTATGSLSVCIRDVMEWEAAVTLVSDDMQASAPFRFITSKTPAASDAVTPVASD